MNESELREKIIKVLGPELYGAYDCIRVWEAWSYGTMSQDDFVPVEDRLGEIAESLLKEILGDNYDGTDSN
jgi:hypothetical protein